MKNADKILYTCLHRRAMVYVIKKLIREPYMQKRLLKRAESHDLDKSLLCLFVDKKTASRYHRQNSSHHMENNIFKIDLDKIEAVLDYECAGYTKPDKPRNAYDTIQELKPELMDELLPIMQMLGIAKSYSNTPDDPDWIDFNQQLPEITEEYAMAEIIQYVMQDETKNNAYIVLDYAKTTAGIDVDLMYKI